MGTDDVPFHMGKYDNGWLQLSGKNGVKDL